MPIKLIDTVIAEFPDINGVMQSYYGIPLADRNKFSEAQTKAYALMEQNPSSKISELINISEFKISIETCLRHARINITTVHSAEKTLIPELLLIYGQGPSLYRGTLESIEFPYRSSGGDASNNIVAGESENFSEIWLRDCDHALHKIKGLGLDAHERFSDLLALLIQRINNGFHEAYDSDEITREATEEALNLFGLSSKTVSAGLAVELLFSAIIEPEAGQYRRLPGWFDQLCNPPQKLPRGSNKLSEWENPYHVAIASFISENYPIDIAIDSINTIPYPKLTSIAASRAKMIEKAHEEAATRAKYGNKKVDPETREKLTKDLQNALSGMASGENPLAREKSKPAPVNVGNGKSEFEKMMGI